MILSVKYHNGGHDIQNAMAVGATLYGMILVTGKLTGASINPAVGLVQSVF